MRSVKARLLFAGGGSGGHVIPGLALAEALAAAGGEPFLVTGGRPVEERLAAGVPWPREVVDLEGGPLRLLRRLPLLVRAMRRTCRRRRIEGVVALGGRVGLPAALAGKSLGLPLYLLEINGVAGRTTRVLAPLARKIFNALPAAADRLPREKVVQSGVPLRAPFHAPPPAAEARRSLGLSPGGGPVLLVFGGSMGARSLNRIVLAELARPGRLPPGCRVLHVTGPEMVEEARRAWRETGLESLVFPFLARMELALAAADLVICRGGAMTMAEVAALGRPALVVPYPWHRDRHQELNAAPLVEQGRARLMPQERLADELAGVVGELIRSPARLRDMAGKGRPAPGRSPAALILAEILGRG